MSKIELKTVKHVRLLVKCLPIFSFAIPFGILYFLDPASFEMTWEGRTYYLFFLWLMLLETILNENELRAQISGLRSPRTLLFIASLTLPTVYVIGSNYFGWNGIFLEIAERGGVPFANLTPLAMEYLVFTVFFVTIAVAEFGIVNLKSYSITAVFLGAIGTIYMINNLYPYGQFTPFQVFVPTATMLAAGILNLMGYRTSISYAYTPQEGSLPVLSVQALNGNPVGFKIAWPCSGIESLLIYSITIALFLKSNKIQRKEKLVYFVFGAIITYLINGLRIVTLYMIALGGSEVTAFHDYYGQLYSISWIMAYPLIIMASRALTTRIRLSRYEMTQTPGASVPIRKSG
jgi:thaumarchaeosortase